MKASKRWLVAALGACAGILSANARANFAYVEKAFSLLPPEEGFAWAEAESALMPPAGDFAWDEATFWLMPDEQNKTQEALESIFDTANTPTTVEPTYDASGVLTGHKVTLGTSYGPLAFSNDFGKLTIDLKGWAIKGRNGVNGTSITPGGNGGAAITVAGQSGAAAGKTDVRVENSAATSPDVVIVGGNGGDGNPAGKGSPAVVDATGAEVAVTAPEGLVRKGDDGAFLPPADWKPVGTDAWIYVEDGVGHICGTGVATNLPASFDLNSITNVIVESGITEIGGRFFKKCSKLNTATLGADVSSVGTNAFYLCVSLEKIKVENVAVIDSLSGAIVYRTALKPDGTPYVIPFIDAPGYENVLYATDDLANPNWQRIKPEEAFADGAPARFFRYVLEPEGGM